jgi:NAD-dependent SIR2 family protein deacetylase
MRTLGFTLLHLLRKLWLPGKINRGRCGMKKKLLITVGAGASMEFGLPSVSKIDTLFDECAGRCFPLASDPTSNLYKYCREAIQTYYSKSPKPALGKSVNFEEVLYQLNLLVPYFSDPNRLHGSNALLVPGALPDVLEDGHGPKAVDGNGLRNMTSILLDTLVDHFIDGCAAAAVTKSAQITQLGAFLAALRKEFDIGVITLNYDDIFTQAFPGLYTGFDPTTGEFEPLSVFRRARWGFIYHLHGSIHFAMMGGSHDMHRIRWEATPTKDASVHATGRNTQDSMEGTAYPTSTIVAGYGKTLQILRQPFRTYFAQVSRLIQEADSLLFLGYGFGDLHLNAAFSEVRNRRRPVVIVGWADDKEDPLPFRHDTWSHQLIRTLPTNAGKMSMPGHAAPASIREIKDAGELEVSNDPDYPLAVWYNGLLEACQNPDKIISHLR